MLWCVVWWLDAERVESSFGGPLLLVCLSTLYPSYISDGSRMQGQLRTAVM